MSVRYELTCLSCRNNQVVVSFASQNVEDFQANCSRCGKLLYKHGPVLVIEEAPKIKKLKKRTIN